MIAGQDKLRNLRKIDMSIIKKDRENIPKDVLINIASLSFSIFSLLCNRSFQRTLPHPFFIEQYAISLSLSCLTVKRVIEQRPDLTWRNIIGLFSSWTLSQGMANGNDTSNVREYEK